MAASRPLEPHNLIHGVLHTATERTEQLEDTGGVLRGVVVVGLEVGGAGGAGSAGGALHGGETAECLGVDPVECPQDTAECLDDTRQCHQDTQDTRRCLQDTAECREDTQQCPQGTVEAAGGLSGSEAEGVGGTRIERGRELGREARGVEPRNLIHGALHAATDRAAQLEDTGGALRGSVVAAGAVGLEVGGAAGKGLGGGEQVMREAQWTEGRLKKRIEGLEAELRVDP